MSGNKGFEERVKLYFNVINDRNIEEDMKSIFGKISFESKLYILAFAPGLISFVNWVLDEAQKSNKDRLYFLSRDGYQMFLIAQVLVKEKNLDIECKYLNLSRHSMRLPGYHLDIDKCMDEICVGGIDITCRKILKRGGLTDEECCDVLEDIGKSSESDRILNYREVLNLRQILEKNELAKNYIYTHSVAVYRNCVGYLRQEGLLKDDKFAIVDSGWIGTLQCSIEKIIQSINPEINVEGYYFGMYEMPHAADINKFHAYFFGAKFGLGQKVIFSNSLFETIVSAPERMTLKYRHENDKYLPVFSMSENPNNEKLNANNEALKLLLASIKDFRPWLNINRKVVNKLFMLFMARPGEYELRAYGDDRFSDDVLDGCFKKVAAELTYKQIRDQRLINKLLIVGGIKKKTIHESAWLEGSVVRCGKNINYSLRHIRLYKFFIYARKQIHS